MERRGTRRSFEKPRVEAPPRLQVIGFNVSPRPMKAAEVIAPATSRGSLDMVTSATASYNELPISPSQLSKPAASSPRSALQQLLLHQSLPCTSPTSFNQSLPPLNKPSPNQNSRPGLLQPDFSSPAAANQKRPSGGLLQPSTSPAVANQKSTSGISKPQSPPSAYQSNSSNGRLKSLVQSELMITTSDILANQCSRGSRRINQRNAKPAKAVLIKEKYEAFFQAKKTDDDGNGAKVHEIKGQWIIGKADHSHAAKSKKSSWLHNDGDDDDDDDDDHYSYEDDHPSAAVRCQKSSWNGVQPISEHSPSNEKSRKSSRSEEKNKKSGVFIMFVSSSPAPDDHHQGHDHQGHSGEHNASTTMDFLSCCHLCRRPLGHGQDIFMYSGDKAFCSMECRYQQIVIDERKERCPPSIIRSGASTEFHHSSIAAKATHHPIMINKPYFINTAAAA